MTAHMRRWVYLITGLVAAIVPILVAVGVIDTGQGESVNNLFLSLSSLLGAGGATVAATVTHRQIKDGVHDPALPPADQALESFKEVAANQQQANADMDRLREAANAILAGGVTAIGGVAAATMTDDNPLSAILKDVMR